MAWQKALFRELLQESDTFVHCVELVTSRGLITERSGRRVLRLARQLVDHPDIHALSITDNPGGNPMINADTMGTDLISRGQEVIIHLSCKDWNRNALQGRSWQLASDGFRNVLALSGDYPVGGYRGQASGVFDIDSVGLLEMLRDMNAGIKEADRKQIPKSTDFFLGAVVTNHKLRENEVMPQYFKLTKKIRNGAAYIINQIGYDARKQDELIKYMAMHDLEVPTIGNVYVLGKRAAQYFHAGKVPGVVVNDELMKLVEKHADAPDKGKSFFLEFAAKQCAIFKGLGYRGIYLGGHLKYEDFARVLEVADSFAPDDWKIFAREIRYQQPDEFFYLEEDPDSGLNTTKVNPEYRISKEKKQGKAPISYRLNRFVHDKIFKPETAGFKFGQKIYASVDKAAPVVKRIAHGLEHAAKMVAFDCRDCGDCSLPDIAYLCPQSQCVKNQRNGPCGGTRQGKCEVGEKECIWALAYDRLKAYGEEETMLDGPAIIKDGALQGSSAWTNTFLQRDHHAKQSEPDTMQPDKGTDSKKDQP
jgi:methylenetetrahydrofolate reductase (NADPH)